MNSRATVIDAKVPLAAFRQLVRVEAKLALRVPVGILFGFAAPVVLLVIFTTIPGMRGRAPGSSGGLSQLGTWLPVLIGLVLTLVSLISLPTELADHRQRGFLRRFSATPVAASWLLGAQVVVNLAIALVAIAVIVVGCAVSGVPLPAQPVGFVVALALAIGAIFSIGLLMCAVVPAPQAAGPLGSVLLFPLLFFAGMWVPRAAMSPLLRTIGDFTPLGAASQALQDAMTGSFPSIRALAVMVAYAVVLSLAATRLFRWE
jgi:ABC-2 type transport system permease protein